jgi:hypothetical protein
MSRAAQTAGIAWLVTAIYYFYQYSLRSAPAVMMPQLSEAFGLSAMGVASMAGLFYYGYSPFSLVAGVAMDRLGREGRADRRGGGRRRRAAVFDGQQPAGQRRPARTGRGGVFALIGAAYIATTNFPASRAATLIGATQMFGMAGGFRRASSSSGPLIGAGVCWSTFWAGMGIAGLVISALLFALLPAVGAGREACRLAEGRRSPRSPASFATPNRSCAGSSRASCSSRRRSST